jgi:hypothetical protein
MGNHDMNPLSLNNPSLDIIYYIMMLSNHRIIRLVRFVSRFDPEVMERVLSLIHI